MAGDWGRGGAEVYALVCRLGEGFRLSDFLYFEIEREIGIEIKTRISSG